MTCLELPRLTGSLRAFSGLSSPVSTANDVITTDYFEKKRKARARKEKEAGISWENLKSAVDESEYCTQDKHIQQEIKLLLRELVQGAGEIVGSDCTVEAKESTAAFIFDIFKDSESVSQSATSKLKSLFGAFPASAATKCCHIVCSLRNLLPEDFLDKLSKKTSAKNNEPILKPFGHNIKFYFPSTSSLSAYADLLSDSEDETENCDDDHVTKLLLQGVKGNVSKGGTDGDAFVSYDSSASAKDISWFRQQCEIYFKESDSGDLSVTDMCSALFDILTSPREDSAIQNDLFDLLGFDRIEFIQELLNYRQDIIDSTLPQLTYGKSVSTADQGQRRPNYGCQVTVQSEEEKLLLKQMRKEGRKQARRDRVGPVEVVDDEAYLKSIGFDPERMRAERESSLQVAQNTPLFSQKKRAAPGDLYPHVYDNLARSQQSTAFVSGSKIALPLEAERKNTKMYEEVVIPPSSKFTEQQEHRVPISELDEIGQIAFKGTKQLNRIQSIVFDAAYSTNENLLICAPTGAGKTNIAMLTIVREIKQNIEQGVVKKDRFKIVYVAPMKALAAEMVRNFGQRLAPLGISVKELTGDMQLTKSEIQQTQMLVTTPEKWDVVTRKGSGDAALSQLVKLLIIDEVHLLHDDRGVVIECLVARTLRQIESSQSMIRIVGLSATLPNYLDVARFLQVSPYQGLFFFDGRFRPVPLGQTFIGIKALGYVQRNSDMDSVCYEKVRDNVDRGYQAMVFVHARNAAVKTALTLREMANNHGDSGLFQAKQSPVYGAAEKQVMRSRNKQLRELFPDGFGFHHAGMLRQDRTMVEDLFSKGLLKVLVCTATLAWGVNLPAHAVIIKGTEMYDAKKGSFVDIGILDVLQIFGRAGRPQFDKFGEGIIITTHEKLSHYLALLTRQSPIESQFESGLRDSLNAEIALGTVTNVEEGVEWLSYTYLHIRMLINPLAYGIRYGAKENDPLLEQHRRDLITAAGRDLDKARMVRFNERTGNLNSTDVGRIASHFYIKRDTIEVFNEKIKEHMDESEVLAMVSHSQEFEQIKVRDDEISELEILLHEQCWLNVAGGVENSYGKVNILLQSYVTRSHVESFSLVSDLAYVAQNSARILRALFEMLLKRGWPRMASQLLTISKVVDKRLLADEHPLRQFTILNPEILHKLEIRKATMERLKDMTAEEIGHLIKHVRMGKTVKACVRQFPAISIAASIQPITRTVLRVRLTIKPEFEWSDRVHGGTSEPWWIWVEDPENNHIYHSEYFLLQRKQVKLKEEQNLVFTIPIFDPLPPQYYIRATSDRWLAAEAVCAISFQHLILPEHHPPHTELLDLQPLPITALKSPQYEMLYKFTHFNPVQTQVFHTLYHSDHNVLLGAPTGSGKTVAAELAIFRVFNEYPNAKAVYIAPLKALVRERIEDWKDRFVKQLGKNVIELTGDTTPDMRAIANADVIVTTPEKWDGVSRSWQNRSYVKAVALLVIDEIHLLGDERGPVLEVIVSRTNFISSHTDRSVRVVGLSTALANARDLAAWLGITQAGMFNFRPSVRPVPLDVHIAGFSGKHYCPRMASMNKPTYQAIRTYSPSKPVLIFVSSRRQTRLTALDLMAFLAADEQPKQWMHMPEQEMDSVIATVRDTNLKLMLSFGIGLHHAGLHERDRKTVEELFVNQKIQVLIATSTLAWGVNFPAHLVVVKGTEYFDGKTNRYVDFPITDVLQMMGRAGRPQFDDHGVAMILVHDIKKHFYKKFLYEPFPVESNLVEVLSDHLNAEVVAGTITSKQDAMDYITWTYLFRRLVMNPSYYELDNTEHDTINRFLSTLVEKSVTELEASYCLEVSEDNVTITPGILGRISSYYYLSHLTVRMFRMRLHGDCSLQELLKVLADAEEYTHLPVRHNEDAINSKLAEELPLEVDPYSFDNAHTKAHLLFQAHFSRLPLPSSDYFTDTKSVLDQAIRILQAMIDVSADEGWLATVLRTMHLVQMVVQGRWLHDCSLLTLPGIETDHLPLFKVPRDCDWSVLLPGTQVECLPELLDVVGGKKHVLMEMLHELVNPRDIDQVYRVMANLPQLHITISLRGIWAESQDGKKEDRLLSVERTRGVQKDWVSVHADQEYVLKIDMNQETFGHKRGDFKAHAPHFPKAKDVGWFVVLGEVNTGELLALKRVGCGRKRNTTVSLSFYTPEEVGRRIYTVYFMSDSYIGLDQQYDLHLEVIEADIASQINTEVVS